MTRAQQLDELLRRAAEVSEALHGQPPAAHVARKLAADELSDVVLALIAVLRLDSQ